MPGAFVGACVSVVGHPTMIPLFSDTGGPVTPVPLVVVNQALEEHHYLGPARSAVHCLAHYDDGELVQAQVWRFPTARLLGYDNALELSRWVILPAAGPNAGSWFMARVVRWMREHRPDVDVLVSYSELGRHDGALYRACNWTYAPTHHAERFFANGVGYPSGHGSWDGHTRQAPKQRWIYEMR